jgi:hypothetical protein
MHHHSILHSNIKCHFMSQPYDISSDISQCAKCGHAIPLLIAKSNTNGNAGRVYAKCNRLRPNSSKCDNFHWQSPKSTPDASQTASPNLESAVPSITDTHTIPAVSQALKNFAATSSLRAIPTTLLTCNIPGCTWTCINTFCTRKMCHKHCVASGGCAAKGHNGQVPAVEMMPLAMERSLPAPNQPIPRIAPPWILDPPCLIPSSSALATSRTSTLMLTATHAVQAVSPSTESIAPLVNAASLAQPTIDPPAAPVSLTSTLRPVVNPCPDPHYISQMLPIFTQQIAREQQLIELCRTHDAEQLIRMIGRKSSNSVKRLRK